jgi:nucleoid-associated protein YgaU
VATVQKAFLKVEQGPKIECWFNPKDFTLSKTNKWKVEPKAGQALPDPEFTGSDAQKINLDLLFDDSEATDGDVRGITRQLFEMMKVDDKFKTGDKNNARPPKVEFGWGQFVTFKAVCDSLSVTYTMFTEQGIPIRANAKLGLTQVEPAVIGRGGGTSRHEPRQNPTTMGIAGLRSHVVRDGDSLQSIAYAAYGDATLWRKIADANGIDDPTRLKRGTVLTIPRIVE